MFSGCASLTNINLSNFNTQKVTNMEYMFSGCTSLTNINLSNFNTQKVTNMECMFKGCSSLTDINLSNFNTQNVTNMRSMFSGCSSLKEQNLPNFYVQNLTNPKKKKIIFICTTGEIHQVTEDIYQVYISPEKTIGDLINIYCKNRGFNKEELYFLYGGGLLNHYNEKKIKHFFKEDEIKILVYRLDDDDITSNL